MNNLNFFEPHKKKPERTGVSKSFIVRIILLTIMLVVIIVMIFRQITVINKEKAVATLEQLANDPLTVEKVNNIRMKQEALSQYNQAVSRVEDLDSVIQLTDIIDEELFAKIEQGMPETAYMNSISVQSNGFNISGVSLDRYSIADFQDALSEIEDVTDVFTSNITENEGIYDFTISVAFNEVNIEELFQEEETTEGEDAEGETPTDGETKSEVAPTDNETEGDSGEDGN